jgi:hypothetical protein
MSVEWRKYREFITHNYKEILIEQNKELFTAFIEKNKENYAKVLAIEEEATSKLKQILPFSDYYYERNTPYSNRSILKDMTIDEAFYWKWFELSPEFKDFDKNMQPVYELWENLSQITDAFPRRQKLFYSDIPNWNTYFHNVPTPRQYKDAWFKENREKIIELQPEILKSIVACHLFYRDNK